MGLLDGYNSLSNGVNTIQGVENTPEPVLLPELELSMTDDELIELKKDWMTEWKKYEPEVVKAQNENENYWLGKQFTVPGDKRPIVDNLIFESLETFLPIATRPKAEPIVEGDNTELGNALADKVRKMIAFRADQLSLNIKMKQVARYWALYMLGCMKVGWSMKENDIICVPVRPQKLILDPCATVDNGDYNGKYIGEILTESAANLIIRFPKKSDWIKNKVMNKMGTNVEYIIWCTNDYVFWTCGDEVLDKTKNPHWNYETEQPGPMDAYGQPTAPIKVKGKNHFKSRRIPYVFLSVFNIGKHPHDDTNLIQQNIGLQDLVNKRISQIDKNADSANGGLMVSGDAFTKEQAKEAGKALREGGAVWVPTGPVGSSVVRDSGQALPSFVYESLVDYRNELRNIFGTRGSTPQGTMGEQTVGGKNIIRGQDSDRIGGGISTYLEEFTDKLFNWFVQLMYVYYDEPHSANVLGQERAHEYITLINSDFICELNVGVKEGSMIPRDPASERGEALELWKNNALDPITLFNKLDFPNPRESAKSLYLWQSNPVSLFPDLMQQQQQDQAQQQQQQTQQQQEQQAQQQQATDQKHLMDMQKMHLSTVLKGK
jgi:hypothetical protein